MSADRHAVARIDAALDAALAVFLEVARRNGAANEDVDAAQSIVVDALDAAPAAERIWLLDRLHSICAGAMPAARSASTAGRAR